METDGVAVAVAGHAACTDCTKQVLLRKSSFEEGRLPWKFRKNNRKSEYCKL